MNKLIFTSKLKNGFLVLLFCVLNSISVSQETADFFKTNCASCHTIGGGQLTGPDLKNVTQRKDRDWLTKFILDPKSLIDAGDSYALQLQKDARGAVMPTLPTLSKSRVEAILNLIEAESKLGKSQFVGIQVSDRPFTQEDVENGENIFIGNLQLANGGPQCMSCHTVNGISQLGGGTLAPDLTTVFERYEGRKILSTWLSAPATPTMQSVFKKQPLESEEILSLVAYFQHTLQRNPEDASTVKLSFIFFGIGGVIVFFGVFDLIWNKRFTSVRRVLVQSKKIENTNE